MIPNKSLYGSYRNRKFTDIFPDEDTFKEVYNENQLPKLLKDTSVLTTYYLLYAYYGNSTIASSDENQFKYKLFSTMYRYGPTWEKRLDIQDKLRTMNENDLILGSINITNMSVNPSTEPSTETEDILPTINNQNVNKYKRSKLNAYGELWNLIKTDVTGEYIDKFKKLFLTVVEPEVPLWYVTDDEEDE